MVTYHIGETDKDTPIYVVTGTETLDLGSKKPIGYFWQGRWIPFKKEEEEE